ncbi:putative RNA-directed DNA polymerase, partial [Tanacetum coccineum]
MDAKQTLYQTLKDLAMKIDQGVADQNDFAARSNARANLNILEAKAMKDLAQRSKIKWSIEGDENSKYFHGILNSKRRYLAIKGIKWEGEWVTDAQRVKDTFMEHFREKFSPVETISVCHRSHRFKSVNETQCLELIKPLSLVELKQAVWSCGNDKAPGPDGFTFSLLKRYWDMFQQDIFNFVSEFFNTGFIPFGCNSSFITLIPKVINPMNVGDYRPISLIGIQYKIIAKVMALRLAKVVDSVVSMEQSAFIKGRQILDGPLMVNEILALYKKKKKKAMIFKVDFEKAFDSLSWNYLDRMMEFMHFPDKWRGWIRACLHSARASVLVNGSSSNEFRLHRGLRQGDPLSPFLFIIAMEGLHIAMEDAKAAGLFHGLNLDNIGLHLSRLLYADDVIFMGEWSDSNVRHLLIILHYFHMSSGLKINLSKSYIYGIGVSNATVTNLANEISVRPGKIPFIYLGLPVGSCMSRIKAWDVVISRFNKRLSMWKISSLSIGGRSMLIKSVQGSLGIYYFSLFVMPVSIAKKLERIRSRFFWGNTEDVKKISWIKWDLVLASHDHGGLDIGSLVGFNIALILKWWWRFVNNESMLWVRVIKSIYGNQGGFDRDNPRVSGPQPWARILSLISRLKAKNVVRQDTLQRKIGDGTST